MTTPNDDETTPRKKSLYQLAVGACNACPAPVYWLVNDTTGKRAPIDAVPDDARGNIVIDDTTGTYRVIYDTTERRLARERGTLLHLNHFVTCPAAKKFASKPKPKKGPRA